MYRLLLVEDNQGDRELARERLADVPGFALTIDEAGTLGTALLMIESRNYDSLVVDLNLPDSWGLATIETLRLHCGDTPIVVLSGDARENLRADVLRAGAQDFLGKNEASAEFVARAILYSLERHRSEALRRRIEEFMTHSPDGVVVTDAEGRVLFVNEAAVTMLDRSRDELLAEPFTAAMDDSRTLDVKVLHTAERKTAELRVVPYVWNHREAFLTTLRDVTERTRLAEQLRHSQKLEAVGQLAGGVAHDFNNILTVILASTEIVLERTGDADPARRWLVDIQQASRRAAALTRQLLTFARRHVPTPTLVDINETVIGIHKMLGRVIGENITIELALQASTPPVLIDADQLGQVLTNLVVNARDAMPYGGTVTIRTATRELADHDALAWSLARGRYVSLVVQDTGEGIRPELLDRIFEPFFTTKDERGTGLGLSMVHGIVTQAGGQVRVESEPGAGATFSILLPAESTAVASTQPAAVRQESLAGTERILVVEDEPLVRTVATEILERSGYSVEAVPGGQAALETWTRAVTPFDLVLTDVVMSGVSGWALGEQIRARAPQQKIIFMSGYSHDVLEQHGAAAASFALLQKPFTRLELLRTVRQVLDH